MHIVPPQIPTGTVFPFAGPTAKMPSGWLHCNGSAVSRSAYAALFDLLGVTHGQGDGATSFNIPDYRGRFLRGVDGGAGKDPDRGGRLAMNIGGNIGDNVGSVQVDQFASHNHTMSYGAPGNPGYVGGANNISFGGLYTDLAGGSETRPKNANVHYMIKV